MDLASIVGLVMCLVLVIFCITYDEGKLVFENLTSFLDAPSAILHLVEHFAVFLPCVVTLKISLVN